MATEAVIRDKIELQDGTIVEIRALSIKRLRKFMEVVERFETMENESESLDIVLDAAAVALEPYAPELAGDKDKLEEQLDIPTAWQLLEVAGGLQRGNQTATTGPTGRR